MDARPMVDVGDTQHLPTVLSLCTGYGGIERGLELAGFEHRVITHVEIEAFAIANLVNKMEAGELDAAPVWSNLKTLPVDCFRDRVDLLTGGYPCQPFSHAGKRAGKDDPRHLWPYILDIIRAVRPVQCFFENVEGHISLGLREVISDLESLGYKTAWGIFSASEVGAPHQRKRVYILGNTGIPFGDDSEADSQCADTDSVRPHREEEHRCGSVQRGIKLQHQQERESGQVCEDVADTVSERLEGHSRHGEDLSESRWLNQKSNRPTCQSGVRIEEYNWLSEPNVGRVADGVRDRVDRIRLLGNGVVPQTAAKAWLELSSFNGEYN
jgi:DNA (cytosine-5)-methyltransferase 1